LKEEKLLAMTLPLPPLPEQQRVVAYLDFLERRVLAIRQLRSENNRVMHAFILSTHFHLADQQRADIGEILKLQEDVVAVNPSNQYPQVGVRGFGGGLFARETLAGTDTTYRFFHRLHAGLVVLSQVKGWEGAIAVCPEHLAGKFVSPEYRTFRCINGRALPEYMAALLLTPWFHGKLKDVTRGQGARRERVRPEQFLKLNIPMPTVEQQSIAVKAFHKLREMQLLQTSFEQSMDALLPSVLDKAFRGETSALDNIPFELTPSEPQSGKLHHSRGIVFKRAAIAAFVINELRDDPHLGRTKLEKLNHLLEYHLGVPLEREPVRDAAGPNDYPALRKVESLAAKQRWFTPKGSEERGGIRYEPGANIHDRIGAGEHILGDKLDAAKKLIALLRKADAKQIEIIATLYGSWNDFLLRGHTPSDAELITDVRDNWHEAKKAIPVEKWPVAISWMREKGLVPRGTGRPVPKKPKGRIK
jgi:hypothetical protein